MSLQLETLAGNDRGRVFPLEGPGPWVIGRALDCEVPLQDSSVSRKHGRFVRQGPQLVLEDLLSSYGTQVNGVRISSRALHPGDVIVLGETQLRLTLVVDPTQGTLAPGTLPPLRIPPQIPVPFAAPTDPLPPAAAPTDASWLPVSAEIRREESKGLQPLFEDVAAAPPRTASAMTPRHCDDAQASYQGQWSAILNTAIVPAKIEKERRRNSLPARRPAMAPEDDPREQASPPPAAAPEVTDSAVRLPVENIPLRKTMPARARGEVPIVASLKELVGRELVQFQVESIVGESPSGVVFRARDRLKDRTVALKVLQPEFLSGDVVKVKRFLRAMRAMVPVRHPYLLRILAGGRTGPYCWIAHEYIEGESVAQLIQRCHRTDGTAWPDAFLILGQMAAALNRLSQQRIVHRGVTPRNILIRQSDGVCKLGGVLLAKVLTDAEDERLTQGGERLGELAYLSPEQCRGRDVDFRSDLYSLGATAYAVLTGRPPCLAKSVGETILQIQTKIPELPRARRPDIPETVEEIVMKLLAKNPSERYSDAATLLDECRRFAVSQNWL